MAEKRTATVTFSWIPIRYYFELLPTFITYKNNNNKKKLSGARSEGVVDNP